MCSLPLSMGILFDTKHLKIRYEQWLLNIFIFLDWTKDMDTYVGHATPPRSRTSLQNLHLSTCFYEGTPHIQILHGKQCRNTGCEDKAYLCWRHQLPTPQSNKSQIKKPGNDEAFWSWSWRKFTGSSATICCKLLSITCAYMFLGASECRMHTS